VDNIKNILGLIFIILVPITILIFIILLTLLLINKNINKKYFKLRQQFIYHTNNPIAVNLKLIEQLSKSNEDLKIILDYFTELNKNFTSQLTEIKKQFDIITIKQKTFHLLYLSKNLKTIQLNINTLEKEETRYKKFSLNVEQYWNNLSIIENEINELISMVESFANEQKIIEKFEENCNIFKLLNDKIEKINLNIVKSTDSINVNEIHYSFLEQFDNLQQYNKVNEKFYRVKMYIEIIQLLISELSALSNLSITNQNKRIKISENIQKANNIITNSFDQLSKLKFNDALNNFTKIIIVLQKLKCFINHENNNYSIVAELAEKFKINNQYFIDLVNDDEYINKYEKLQKQFNSDIKINKLISENLELLSSLKKKINVFNDDYENISNLYNNIMIRNLILILNNQTTINKNNEELHLIIKEKNYNQIFIVNNIDSLILKLNYLIQFYKDEKINHHDTINSCENKLIILNEIKKNINEEILENNDKLIKHIENTNDFILKLSESFYDILIQKTFADRVTLYVNRYDSTDQNVLEEYNKNAYKIGNYSQVIDNYLNYISKEERAKK